MNFQFSSDVNKNKIFLVNLTNCRGRLDPYYYKPEFLALRKRLENHSLFQRMGSLIKSWNRGDGPREGFYTDNTEDGVFFLRVNNLKNHTIDTNEIKYINRYVHENTLKRARVTAGDVVFAISGTKDNLGTVSVIPENILEANLNSALVKLELDWSAIGKKYFCYMFDLNITRTQIDFIGKGAAQNNLNNEEISQIHIFLPSISEQEKIVSYLDEAHLKKKKKEEEAQRLLDSIDGYLLSELGINLPEPEENTVQSRVFTRQLCQVSGRRFDPDYYRNFYNKLELAVASTEFTISTMKELTTLIINGNTPASDDYSDEETLYPIIKVGSYEGSFVALSKAGYTTTKKNKLARKDDIFLLSAAHQANYVGRFLKYLENTPREYTSFVGELICIRAKQEICNPIYLYSLLNTALYKDLLNREKTGQTSHIYPKDIQRINIPAPPLAKQDEIADRITAIRTQAKQLRQAAAAELEQSKQEVEAMILGERGNEA